MIEGLGHSNETSGAVPKVYYDQSDDLQSLRLRCAHYEETIRLLNQEPRPEIVQLRAQVVELRKQRDMAILECELVEVVEAQLKDAYAVAVRKVAEFISMVTRKLTALERERADEVINAMAAPHRVLYSKSVDKTKQTQNESP